VTPLDLAAAYAMFPNGGLGVRPRGITSVADADGSVVLRVPVARERLLTPAVAYQMVTMLEDVVDRGTGASARRLGVRFPAGGKTGTTNESKDAWFVGFSSSVVAAVWVGVDTPAPIAREGSGSRFALPIWADFMARAARARRPQPFERPAGLDDQVLCRVSYAKPVDGCPVYTEYFKDGDAVPDQLCTLHRGSIRQRVTRTVQGWVSELGRRVKGLIR
jgi:membrane carboxypeptidase/penicillin-binding protein